MKVLLDTHTFLWFVLNDPQLTDAARESIVRPDNTVVISPASYWEIAIKISLKKYKLNTSYDTFWRNGIQGSAITILPIELRHTARLLDLPFHHKDPFDRLLIAQALADGLSLVSGDTLFDAYGVNRIW